MSTPNATPTEQQAAPATPQAFDFTTWKAAEDAKAAGTGTQAQAAAPAAATQPKPGQPAAPQAAAAPVDPASPAGVDPEDEGDDYAGMPKGVKRQLRQARRDRDQAVGQVRAYEAMIAAGLTPRQAQAEVDAQPAGTATPAATDEPDRANFPNDLAYLKAQAKWEAKHLFAEELARQAGVAAERTEAQQFDDEINAANTKFADDVKAHGNWAEIAEKMQAIPFDTPNQQTMVGLIGKSDNRAALFVHWSDHPEELKGLLALPPHKQMAAFYRMEGRLAGQPAQKVTPATPATPAAPATPKATPASRDAKKAAPSESVKVHEGSPSSGTPSMLLADGTMNPAWMALENEKDGLRR